MADAKQADTVPGDFNEADYDVIYYATASCPFSLRVRSVLEAKAIKYRFVESVWKYDFSSGQKVTVKEKWFTDLYAKAIGRNHSADGQSPIIKIVKEQKLYTDSLHCCRFLDVRFKDVGASVLCLDDADKTYKNEKLLEFINSGFASKVWGLKTKENIDALKEALTALDAKMREFGDDKVSDKYIFGENVSLCDICLLPYFIQIQARLRYRELTAEFKFEEYVKEKCERVSAWFSFVSAQAWCKNAAPTVDVVVAHFKDIKL